MSKPTIRQIPSDELIIDPRVQRNLDPTRVERIVAEYDPEAVGVITVSRRENGTYHVVDGQHRREATRIMVGEKAPLTCKVFTDLTVEDEARLFRILNNTSKPQPLDLFKVRVVEGEPIASHINQIITMAGWQIGLGKAGTFFAVAAAERLYRRNPISVERSILTITKAWGHEVADGRVFEGVGLFHDRYGDAIDMESLVDKLSTYPGGQLALVGKARGLAQMTSTTVARGVAEVVVGRYNVRKKGMALPPWRS